MDFQNKINLFKKRLEWHSTNGYFEMTFKPIDGYCSSIISDPQYNEFIRQIGPIEVGVSGYAVMGVTLPASYKTHYGWNRNTDDSIGEENFDFLDQSGVKIKDVQLTVYDSSLYCWGYDVRSNPSKLVGENMLDIFEIKEFIHLVEDIIKSHEKYCQIVVPDEFNLSR
jgi:hypothetical protein